MSRPLPIVFMGTSEFASPVLQSLDDNYRLIAVVTQPDRPKGRGRIPIMSEVKERALKLGIPVLQPERVGDPASVNQIRRLKPRLIVVAAYGQILPGAILEVPEMGCINVHASLLPRYRGAAPINWAIVQGESETGVTTILMDEGMDTGPVLLRRVVSIDPKDTAGSLEKRLAEMGAEIIVETIQGLERGDVQPVLQDSSQATHAPPLRKKDGWIDWSQPANVLHNRIRGLTPWPGTFTRMGGRILKIFRSEVDKTPQSHPPGVIVNVAYKGIRVATGKGHIILKEVQLEGKRRLSVREFLLGHHVDTGTILGDEDEQAGDGQGSRNKRKAFRKAYRN